MNIKTERFEMRMDAATLAQLDEWRYSQVGTPSRAEAARRLIEQGISFSARKQIHFSDGEKLILTMLSELMKKTNADFDTDIELLQGAIYGGHNWALEWEMPGIFHNHEDDPQSVSDVLGILDTWNSIEEAYEEFSNADKKRIEDEVGPLGKYVEFIGFDGNNEGEYMSIAMFLVNKMSRFPRFKERSLNSHMPCVKEYKKMAEKFEPIGTKLKGRSLSVDEVIQLLKAGQE